MCVSLRLSPAVRRTVPESNSALTAALSDCSGQIHIEKLRNLNEKVMHACGKPILAQSVASKLGTAVGAEI